MKIEVENYKSISETFSFELPNFTVLTGENGSGKTHIFEAISNNRYGAVYNDDKKIGNIRYIPFNQLNPQIDQMCDPSVISQQVNQIWYELTQAKQRVGGSINYQVITNLEQDIIYNNIHNEQVKNFLKKHYMRYKTLPFQLSVEDIADSISLIDMSDSNLFTSQFALIFKTYHIHYLDNKLNKIYQEEGINGPEFLDDERFSTKYGEPPWKFVNSILERLKLPYYVNDPMGTKRDTIFNLKLFHKDLGYEISTDDLSTGEKTLMSLALAIYNTTGGGEQVDMLILDEPDAPLHPSMSKLMLEILEEDIVNKHSIPVIISTHSPTTIACAPAYSLFKITRDNKKPIQCDFSDSVQILTYGIPNLRVSVEQRRQVFVENKYDVEYYEALFRILSKHHKFLTQPQFIPPHGHNGSNCSDVISITRSLRDLGNKQIYGLIDWDEKNKKEEQIVILGLGKRYAIENYLFEPHLLGLYLIKKGFASPEEVGIDECNSYIDVAKKINIDILQRVIDFIESKIFVDKSDVRTKRVESTLISEESVLINSGLFTMQGHALEEKYKSIWPVLKSVRGKGDSTLKNDLINTIINDFPGLLSQDILNTFHEFK
ncbi:hypothetical protein A8L34_13760 [Bacillus sp. FJAT-27264]|uniref:AAA family ATPase n=1 Tax=Paenibacillus sp. (strain DSM 101736 / FJAT-27264) TaxID=1850362 RepID=UPI0008080C43|nr:ATP-binding protein [Bacillus sp. FJAT-27264]OBZ14942.1 hypothetical protein A8L34_13760 [Bacillus sp. FJAT-27264]